MAATERGQYSFRPKEGASGATFITAEPAGNTLKGLLGLLSFDLSPGTTFEQATEIAAYMNAKITALTITTF